jgi:hypothetical protein
VPLSPAPSALGEDSGPAGTAGDAASRLSAMLVGASTAAVIVVVASTVVVVVAVLGLFVWGAIQDGREEKARGLRRRRRT